MSPRAFGFTTLETKYSVLLSSINFIKEYKANWGRFIGAFKHEYADNFKTANIDLNRYVRVLKKKLDKNGGSIGFISCNFVDDEVDIYEFVDFVKEKNPYDSFLDLIKQQGSILLHIINIDHTTPSEDLNVSRKRKSPDSTKQNPDDADHSAPSSKRVDNKKVLHEYETMVSL